MDGYTSRGKENKCSRWVWDASEIVKDIYETVIKLKSTFAFGYPFSKYLWRSYYSRYLSYSTKRLKKKKKGKTPITFTDPAQNI